MYARRARGGMSMGRVLVALAIAAVSLLTYFGSRVSNPITGETQHINISVDQEIALGLEAAPQMAAEYGGVETGQNAQAVDALGNKIVQSSPVRLSPYQFDFHLLDDPETINAFALPGGQVFITEGLLSRLTTEGQVAGVLGHEIAHVVARHSAEQIAKQQLTEGLTGAAVIASYDPNNPATARTAQMAMVIGQLVNMKFGRDDELESDFLGVCFMYNAGYDPNEMIGVMQVLSEASQGNSPPEFFSTHPNPDRRIERIQQAIQNIDQCPTGQPAAE